jgi:Ser/Thr protein kinase RdoA (MazF antagonist)
MTGDVKAAPAGTAGPASRVRTSLPALMRHVAARYRLGEVASWSVLETGYEDCNVDLRAGESRVVVKVFAAGRPASVPARTAGLIEAARAAGVRHPALHRDDSGELVHSHDGHHLIVMDFAAGSSLYELGRPPTAGELGQVIEQAARIHRIGARPGPVFDPWAIGNLVPLAARVGHLMDAEQRRLVDGAIAGITGIDWRGLPEALIHADLTPGNVMISPGGPGGADGTVSILDFALANRWPRLQELAVIAASLLHGAPGALPERMHQVAALYSSVSPEPLTAGEEGALGAFGRAAAAMELLGGCNMRLQGNHGPETDQLIVIGTAGLRDYQALAQRASRRGRGRGRR